VSPANARERYADAAIIACQKRRRRASSGTHDLTCPFQKVTAKGGRNRSPFCFGTTIDPLCAFLTWPTLDIKGVNCRYLTSVATNVLFLRARQAGRPNWA
jgi:hypothetical protein